MPVLEVDLLDETQTRYLTYALSVVNARALPDVRDGLKPVQRRILFEMLKNLRLLPENAHRKSATVVGGVIGHYHPHGDSACYDAMVRMAQDFNFRYPLVDGQGNFGSIDGDSPAAYRYTEVKLTPLALEVLGDLDQETVAERDNFDQTRVEPVVLPARLPHLLINGSSGIAVGMATSIPPHNLAEVIKAQILVIQDPEVSDKKLLGAIKAPDFPTGCSIVNTKAELAEVYAKGKGSIRMRGDYKLEAGKRDKRFIIITSIPYALDKSTLVEKIADLVVARKLPLLVDVRDESTDEIRVVLELASGADPEKVMAYLYKHTNLQSNFNLNLTALVPTDNPLSGRPERLSLREVLQYFAQFRLQVCRAKFSYEKKLLEERIHLLEGLESILDQIKEVIEIVRKSEGRADAASKLRARFKLSEAQSFFIVDLRIYQLSRTNISDVQKELKEKRKRVKEIDRLLKNEKALRNWIAEELEGIAARFGDKRRSKLVTNTEEAQVDAEDFLADENVQVVVTQDGWIKRLGERGDPKNTRVRDGDALLFHSPANTKDLVAFFTSHGNVFVSRVLELPATSGYGEPVQKRYRFGDGEQVVACLCYPEAKTTESKNEFLLYTTGGMALRLGFGFLGETKRTGKRLAKLKPGDRLAGIVEVEGKEVVAISEKSYAIRFSLDEIPLLSQAGKGVIAQKMPDDDRLCVVKTIAPKETLSIELLSGSVREVPVREIDKGVRAKRGTKIVKRGGSIRGLHYGEK